MKQNNTSIVKAYVVKFAYKKAKGEDTFCQTCM